MINTTTTISDVLVNPVSDTLDIGGKMPYGKSGSRFCAGGDSDNFLASANMSGIATMAFPMVDLSSSADNIGNKLFPATIGSIFAVYGDAMNFTPLDILTMPLVDAATGNVVTQSLVDSLTVRQIWG
jgi:hypothetical protein